MNDKKEKCIIFALAGILLLIVCLPVKEKTDTSVQGKNTVHESDETASIINNNSYLNKQMETSAKNIQVNDVIDGGMGNSGSYTESMEQELETLLQYMDGAGRVRVMITLKSTGEDIVEKDRPANRSNVTENDGEGGSRSTNDMDNEEATVYMTDAEGRQIPYVRKTIQPVVEGVAVLAEGGDRESVRKNISETIQALFGIDANKIKIAKMKTIK